MTAPQKVICITGASSGIGRATAIKFAQQGWQVMLGARRLDRLNALADELRRDGCNAIHCFPLDVTSKKSITEFAAKVHDVSPAGIDTLINNAGLALGTDPIVESTADQLDNVIDTNVKGAIGILRAFLPGMTQNRRGHIINLGSIAGFWVYEGGGIYCASKHALDAITRTLRLELNGTGIRVTSIDPGMVETEFSNVRFGGDDTKAKKVYRGLTPLSPDDVANSIWFVATQPSHVNIDRIVLMPVDQASVFKVNRQN